MQDTALDSLYQQDAFVAIETLCRQPNPLAATKGFADVVSHLYWKQKDIHSVIVMAQAGIQYGLTAALPLDAHDETLAAQIRGIAKGLAYDIGSFTWPGWDEPGIVLEEEHLRFGREAAKVNLRLAHSLKKGDLPISRAIWLVGAHCLAAQDYDIAGNHFAEATRYAQLAGASETALLSEGFQCLTSLLAAPSAAKDTEFTAIQTRLAGTPDGVGLADQLKTAKRVFSVSAD